MFPIAAKFSALFAKTWRVNKLFHNPNAFKRIKVTEMDVIKPYIIIMGVNLIVLSCWTAISPLRYKRFNYPGTDEWNRVIATYGICTSESESDFWPFLGVILAINCSLLVIANIQAYQARSIQTEYSESRYILIIMMGIAQMFSLAVPCISLLSRQPKPYFVVMLIVICCISATVLGVMFWPKIVHTRSWLKEKAGKEKNKDAKKASADIDAMRAYSDSGDDGLKVVVMNRPDFSSLRVPSRYLPDATKFKSSLKDESDKFSSVRLRTPNHKSTTEFKAGQVQFCEDIAEEEKDEITDEDHVTDSVPSNVDKIGSNGLENGECDDIKVSVS
jgi:hypothetical protein